MHDWDQTVAVVWIIQRVMGGKASFDKLHPLREDKGSGVPITDPDQFGRMMGWTKHNKAGKDEDRCERNTRLEA